MYPRLIENLSNKLLEKSIKGHSHTYTHFKQGKKKSRNQDKIQQGEPFKLHLKFTNILKP